MLEKKFSDFCDNHFCKACEKAMAEVESQNGKGVLFVWCQWFEKDCG